MDRHRSDCQVECNCLVSNSRLSWQHYIEYPQRKKWPPYPIPAGLSYLLSMHKFLFELFHTLPVLKTTAAGAVVSELFVAHKVIRRSCHSFKAHNIPVCIEGVISYSGHLIEKLTTQHAWIHIPSKFLSHCCYLTGVMLQR